jgi:lactoylglutathione lyase
MALIEKTIEPATVSLGYVILYVADVSASLCFYADAFGLARRFFHVDGNKAYGEMDTGATRLAFASLNQATEHLKQEVTAASLDKAPLAVEIALVTKNLPVAFARAVKAGATVVSEPAVKPWGQSVAYLRDNSGHLVELCTPVA